MEQLITVISEEGKIAEDFGKGLYAQAGATLCLPLKGRSNKKQRSSCNG